MMSRLRVVRDRVRALVRRDRVAHEIAEELGDHRRRLAERLQVEGRSPEDAAREAARRVGNAALLQDAGYDVRGGGRLEAALQDVRYAIRFLRRQPAFALVAVCTAGVGIGANTAIFSVAHGVLLRPLPYPDAGELAMVWMDNARIRLSEDWHSYPDYEDYRDGHATFSALAIFNATARTLTGRGDPERLLGAHSSPGLFDLLGVRPALGRTYTADEDRPGAAGVVVLSHGLWQRAFGGRPDALGQSVALSGRPHRIIGVMPEGFAFPSPETAFWVPTAASDASRQNRGALWLQMIGRRRPGVTVPQAQADLARINASIIARFPDQKGYGVNVVGYHDQIVGRVRPAVLVLVGAVACVLLIACANVANLLLARASARERELALRSAIGAGRGRIVRQLLTESLVLGSLGGALGLALAFGLLRAFIAAAPAGLPRIESIGIDGWVLAFTLGLSFVTGLLFGLAPALHAAGADRAHALREGGRTATGPGARVRRGLVVAEVALAVVLLVGAGLMMRSFVNIQRVDLGFDPAQVLAARITLAGERYGQAEAVAEFFRQVVARTEVDPAIDGAAGIGTVLLSATPNSTNFSIEGRPDFPPEDRVEVPVDSITPNYFAVMRVPLVAGRHFDDRDSRDAPPAVIVNQTMARMFWPGEDPVGRRIKYGQLDSGAPWMTIVGVVADTRRTGYDAAVRPETYLPHAQSTTGSLTIVVRAAGGAARAAPILRAVVRSIDPLVPLASVGPLEDQLRDLTAQRRLNTLLLGVFGLVAAGLAAIGVYGVIAYSVDQRTRELGVRLALGASAPGILGLVLREGLTLAAIGLAAGLAGAWALGRTLTSLLFGVSATDPATFAVIGAVTAGLALLACVIPAIRAIGIEPVTALRAE
jgi:putative ABC transport system permease protein